MSRTHNWLWAVMGLCALTLVPPSAAAEADESAVEASLDVALYSAYVWRGQVLNDEAVVQPSLTVSKNGFSINWWGNLNLTDNATGDEHEFSEHDVGVSYTRACPLTGAEVTLGLANYDFPNTIVDTNALGADALSKNTHEVYLSFALSEIPLAPTLLVSYDINEVDGLYFGLAIAHTLEINEKVSVELSASAGYADSNYNLFYFGVDDDALNEGNLGLAIPIVVSDSLTISPTVQYAMFFDSEIEDGAEEIYGEKDYLSGGVNLSYSF